MAKTDPVQTPLRENGRSKWRVLKKRRKGVKLHFQRNQSKFNKGTQSLIYLSEEDSNRRKSLLYFDGDQNWRKKKLKLEEDRKCDTEEEGTSKYRLLSTTARELFCLASPGEHSISPVTQVPVGTSPILTLQGSN